MDVSMGFLFVFGTPSAEAGGGGEIWGGWGFLSLGCGGMGFFVIYYIQLWNFAG